VRGKLYARGSACSKGYLPDVLQAGLNSPCKEPPFHRATGNGNLDPVGVAGFSARGGLCTVCLASALSAASPFSGP